MSTICCDTSFLISLYGDDSHSLKAIWWLRRNSEPLVLSPFNLYEFSQGLHFSVWRGAIPASQATRSEAQLHADLESGRLVQAKYDVAQVFQKAHRLTATYTMSQGFRAFDILHVASALQLEAKLFLSFDIRQRKLAAAESLKLNPA